MRHLSAGRRLRSIFAPLPLGLALVSVGCGDKEEPDELDIVDSTVDLDGDGFAGSGDCDDTDASINIAAIEVCDGVDNDCDGVIDDDPTDGTDFYPDTDEDGFGDSGGGLNACEAPSGYVANDEDCDDTKASVSPDGTEVCDGEDNDCDGDVDNDPTDGTTYYPDADEDGFGAADSPTVLCEETDGYILDNTDCDDGSDQAFPGGTEICDDLDNDCDGTADWGMNVPADFGTIQAAIDGASGGEEVCVSAGTYTENIDFSGKDLTLTGSFGSAETTIDGGAAGAAVTFSGGETAAAVLQGFTVTNGLADMGAGIHIAGGAPTLHELVITGNACTDPTDGLCAGVGVAAVDGGFTMSDTTIEANTGSGYDEGRGAGIYLSGSTATADTVDVRANTFTPIVDEQSDVYGVGVSVSESVLSFTNGAISENAWEGDGGTAEDTFGFGGGLYGADATLTIADSAVDSNRLVLTATGVDMELGGGGAFLVDSEADITGTSFSSNVVELSGADAGSSAFGGGLTVHDGASFAAVDMTVADNSVTVSSDVSAAQAASGGLHCTQTTCTLTTSTLSSNTVSAQGTVATATAMGGGMSCDAATCELTSVTVEGNAAEAASDEADTHAAGGGVHATLAVLTVTDSAFSSNSLDSTATLAEAEAAGGGVYAHDTDATVTGSIVDANTLTGLGDLAALAWGAGVGVAGDATSLWQISGSALIGNSSGLTSTTLAQGLGAGLGTAATDLELEVTNTEVLDNTVPEDDARGGGLYVASGLLNSSNLIVAGNTAGSTTATTAQGGGLWLGTGATSRATQTNVDVTGNTAEGDTAHGGGVYGMVSAGQQLAFNNMNVVANSVTGTTAEGGGLAFEGDPSSATIRFTYCNIFDNGAEEVHGVADPVGAGGNLSVDPLYTDVSGATAESWDLSLATGSGCIDVGDPAILDADGSTSDIGAYGGPDAAL